MDLQILGIEAAVDPPQLRHRKSLENQLWILGVQVCYLSNFPQQNVALFVQMTETSAFKLASVKIQHNGA